MPLGAAMPSLRGGLATAPYTLIAVTGLDHTVYRRGGAWAEGPAFPSTSFAFSNSGEPGPQMAYAHSLRRTVVVGRDVNGGGGTIARIDDPATDSWQVATRAGEVWDIAWSPTLGLFAMVAEDGIFTSPDGITWTQRSTVSTRRAVVWGGDKFVAVGVPPNAFTGDSPLYSTDGLTWTAGTAAPANIGDPMSIVWSSTLGFVAFYVKTTTATAVRSADGTSGWSSLGTTTLEVVQAVWADDRLVVTGRTGGMRYSFDGATWVNTNTVSGYEVMAWSSIENLLVLGDAASSVGVRTSSDYGATSSEVAPLDGVAVGGLAVGSTG